MTSSEQQPTTAPPGPSLHELLLAVAGRLPDDLVATARSWLAEGRFEDVARALTFALLGYRVPVRESDLIALADVLTAHGAEALPLGRVEVAAYEIAPPFLFTPDPVDENAGGATDPGEAAIGAIDPSTGVGLWTAWRRTADGSPWPPPRRIWLLEVVAGADPVPAGRRLQDALARAGEPHPQVEAFVTGAKLPLYQSLARSAAMLVWAREPHREIRLAAVFDEVDATGTPSFRPGHPRIEDPDERARLVTYLDQGHALLVTPTLAEDVLAPERGPVVPMSFRTDGTWIWSDALTYYLERHALSPEADFLAHVEGAAGGRPTVDGVGVHRALAFLTG